MMIPSASSPDQSHEGLKVYTSIREALAAVQKGEPVCLQVQVVSVRLGRQQAAFVLQFRDSMRQRTLETLPVMDLELVDLAERMRRAGKPLLAYGRFMPIGRRHGQPALGLLLEALRPA